ncbi:22014_t:CDS:1, partial [Racocetra persica]
MVMNNHYFKTKLALADLYDSKKEYHKAWDIFEDLYNKGYGEYKPTGEKNLLTTYMAKYLINGLHAKIDIKRAYKICNKEENINILRLINTEKLYDKKKYEEAWTIFSEIDTCKYRSNYYSSKSENKAKFTAKF